MVKKAKTTKTKVAKPRVKKEVLIEQVKEEVPETKKPFIECPFCQEKAYVITGRDETSSWCQKCGRCFPVLWKTE